MTPTGLHTSVLPLADAVEKMFEFAKLAFPGHQPIRLNVETVTGLRLEAGFTAPAALEKDENLKRFVADLSGKPYGAVSHVALGRQRSPNDQKVDEVKYVVVNDGTSANLEWNVPEPEAQKREIQVAILHALEKAFVLTTYVDRVRSRIDEAERTALQMRERSVADLAERAKQLETFLEELAKRETIHRQELLEKTENEYRARAEKLDAEHRAREEAALARDRERGEALDKRDAELTKKLADFETREAKLVRRKQMEEIGKVLEEAKTFEVSPKTEAKRASVKWAVGALNVVGIAVAGFMVYQIGFRERTDWHFFAGLTASTVTLASTWVYFLKWSDRWFREHADAEFAARRYKADILRANWLAELVSEWYSEYENAELPPELARAFTRNLFNDIGVSRESEHPLDALTGMMKRITSVSIGKGGAISVQGADGSEAPRARHKRRPPPDGHEKPEAKTAHEGDE